MDRKPVILIVDDSAINLQLLAQLLKDDYRIKVANSGAFVAECKQSYNGTLMSQRAIAIIGARFAAG